MTTKVTITAEIHDQKKLVRVTVRNTDGTPIDQVSLKPGESTDQYVYDGRYITTEEVDAPASEGDGSDDGA